MDQNPKLRLLDFQPVYYQDQQMWYLRDPLHLTDHQLIIPTALAPLLTLLDGERTVPEIYEGFCIQIGEVIDFEIISEALSRLDEACLLDNERSQRHNSLYVKKPFSQAADGILRR